MSEPDDTADINRRHWERMVEEGCNMTTPLLDLDAAALRQCARGGIDPMQGPLKVYPPSVLLDVDGKDGAIEFRHYLSDIFSGLVTAGLSVKQVLEMPDHPRQDSEAPPGSWSHWKTYITGFIVLARKE